MKVFLSAFVLLASNAIHALPAFADIKICTFEKLIRRSHYSDTDEDFKNFHGVSFKIDTAKHMLFVQWPDGNSGWFPPDKIKSNKKFTNFILYQEVTIFETERPHIKKLRTVTLNYRLYSDGKRAEVHSSVKDYDPKAARYSCR